MSRKPADAADRFLWNRGKDALHQNWYLRLAIPAELRKYFPKFASGREMLAVVEALNTSDLAVARSKRDALVTGWGHVFARLEKGEALSFDEMKAVASVDVAAEVERATSRILERRRAARQQRHHVSETPEDRERRIAAAEGMLARDEAEASIGRQELKDTVASAVAAALKEIRQGVPEPAAGETISQAAEHWLTELRRKGVKAATLDGHRKHVLAFVEACGDISLTSITRVMASDFLAKLASSLKVRTVNSYGITLANIIDSARIRGRFTATDNPFTGHRRAVGDTEEERVPFEASELQRIFDSMTFEVAPKKHSPSTALPWVTLIAAYTGARLEEIAQLRMGDIRDERANGATVTIIDIHGRNGNNIKNKPSARLVPVHSQLVRAGLLRYRDALPKGSLLFPGLTRRASKGNKIGARIGELFRKKLVALGMKRDDLCFHSLRHTVAGRLDAAEVRNTDAARVLGHAVPGISYGTYSKPGPGLKLVAGVVERIEYPGLKLPKVVR